MELPPKDLRRLRTTFATVISRSPVAELDVQLPGLSGFDLQRELATRSASAPPIILISAHAENLFSSNRTLRGVTAAS